MSNFGALHLRVVRPFELAFREARSAVGPAADVLANAEEFARSPMPSPIAPWSSEPLPSSIASCSNRCIV